MALSEMRSDSKGAESEYMSAPGEVAENVYDDIVAVNPSPTSNKPISGSGPAVSKIILAILTVSLLFLGAIVVWHTVAGDGNDSRSELTLAATIANMTRSLQDQTNKLEVMSGTIHNLTSADQAHSNKLEVMSRTIQNLTSADQAHSNKLEVMSGTIQNLTSADQAHSNKLEVMSGTIQNLTSADQAHSNKLEVMSGTIQNLTSADQAHSNKLEVVSGTIQNITAEIEKQADRLDLINRNLGFADCQEHRDHGSNLSGVYNTDVYGRYQLPVYCDMTTNGGGWTVVLRRKDGSVDFNQTWEAYKNGFGDLSGEFWAGNELMFWLTSRPGKTYRLHVELGSYDGRSAYAEYNVFRVDSEREFYRLHVSGYTGTAGDSLRVHDTMMFSTPESDHDNSSVNCADRYDAGWWYAHCYRALLTGPYGATLGSYQGIIWFHWLGFGVQLKSALMMVRPV